jgi:hypothetical protein
MYTMMTIDHDDASHAMLQCVVRCSQRVPLLAHPNDRDRLNIRGREDALSA